MNSLNGKRVLITRALHQSFEMAEKIKKLDGVPVIIPVQKIQKASAFSDESTVNRLVSEAEWVIFTSANAVDYFIQNITRECKNDLYKKRIAVVGEKTKKKVQEYGISVTFMPEKYTGQALASELGKLLENKSNLLFVKGSLASDRVSTILSQLGHSVKELTVYETVPNRESQHRLMEILRTDGIDILTFLNPYSVDQFYQLIENKIDLKKVNEYKIACIGEVTVEKAKQLGFQHIISPTVYTVEALLLEIMNQA
ncbi:uroporphyrinogen-III synthase [Bacillus sp. RG28]|uniref:Uroporphyrinogen-III synthase n=1 Tax=Gottfriedia endophytica TaxID=2820819 RepID=A0A940SJ65_9BACI|nr:uroporphyrinogen-III synthase [Gottfriedia endophytica]MBP0723903.1 uroporphyrinogen-III synthase [Gottfriedia endophytica]